MLLKNTALRTFIPLRLVALFLFLLIAAPKTALALTLVDMAGREVNLPGEARSVATIGPVPVLNSLVFAAEAGDRIINGLPGNFSRSTWRYQEAFSPGITQRPILQSNSMTPDLEAILKAAPDAVLTMNYGVIAAIERIGVPVLYLSWKNPAEVKKATMIVASLFGHKEKGEEYSLYFDETLERVKARLNGIPDGKRPAVLYCGSIRTMTQPHLIAEWWIEAAGGKSVTRDGREAESLSYSLEQVLMWNPEVLMVSNLREVDQAYADPRLKTIRAVVNRRVYAMPAAAHTWGNRTIEQPLTVLWAAKKFFPDELADLDLETEMQEFYLRFFGYKMSRQQAAEILKGFRP